MECGESSPLLFSHNAKRRGLAALHTLRVDALHTNSEKAVDRMNKIFRMKMKGWKINPFRQS